MPISQPRKSNFPTILNKTRRSKSNLTINNFDAERIRGIVQVFQERVSFLSSLSPPDGDIWKEQDGNSLKMYANALPICFYVGTTLATCITLFNIYRIFINYRLHCAQVIRADYSEVHIGTFLEYFQLLICLHLLVIQSW